MGFNRTIRNKVYFRPHNCQRQKFRINFVFVIVQSGTSIIKCVLSKGLDGGFIPMTGLPQNVVHIFRPKFFFTLKRPFFFSKKRTFPFSDFHGDRTPLNPEKDGHFNTGSWGLKSPFLERKEWKKKREFSSQPQENKDVSGNQTRERRWIKK